MVATVILYERSLCGGIAVTQDHFGRLFKYAKVLEIY